MTDPILLVILALAVIATIVMGVRLWRAEDRVSRYEGEREWFLRETKIHAEELAAKEKRCIRLEQMWRGRDPFVAKLQSLHDRGWRVVVKSHAFQKREDGTAKRDEWGWLVTVIPVDQPRYARWGVLYGAVMGTLEDAMGDTERRVAQIEAVERSEESAAR